ncbi:phospholipase C [Methylacidimicrobium cyclopophantes]|uniref:Phospholipase C n=1 Tax=Methylacidimicrobium cyclopophantes TaxID=1041766 RepID=A0A5E6MQU7_9BACT|nr:alkaline phosphatase family protein [Methylacidimicrobium cyclopophantes]VVM08116.1 phospholipase C [Methylacidimicrobium cyclopophantes]
MDGLDGRIEHIVVLMLENRSFDNLLGRLYAKSPQYDGLSGEETNPLFLHGIEQTVKAWCTGTTDFAQMTIPAPDPGELWTDMNEQIFGRGIAAGRQVPLMNGFVENYAKQPGSPDPRKIMHYFLPEQVPVLSHLAKAFAVCDQWYASAPCQTWPNRFFVHCGTANGYENNWPLHFPYLMPTIFERLSQKKELANPWKVYFHDFPQSLTLSQLWPHLDNFQPYGDAFAQDAARDQLPAYSFLEPRYFPELQLPNDEHPPHDVTLGEQLIADVYNTLRKAPAWTKTLLVITFDEHGGCYDHAPPPLAVPPDSRPSVPFAFDRYGVRVPTVLVSPYIAAGTILRAVPDGRPPHEGPPYPYDHTSILATLRKCFALGEPLTRRDAVAPDFADVLSLERPANGGPQYVVPRPYEGTNDDLQRALQAPLNDFQEALRVAAAHLPDLRSCVSIENRIAQIQRHIEKLAGGFTPPIPYQTTPVEALALIREKLDSFLGRSRPF